MDARSISRIVGQSVFPPRRVPDPRLARRNILGHDRARSDHRAFADVYAGQDYRPAADRSATRDAGVHVNGRALAGSRCRIVGEHPVQSRTAPHSAFDHHQAAARITFYRRAVSIGIRRGGHRAPPLVYDLPVTRQVIQISRISRQTLDLRSGRAIPKFIAGSALRTLCDSALFGAT